MSEQPNSCATHWDDELAAYALDALTGIERERVDAHMDGCNRCRKQLRWLMPAVDLLPASVEQLEPPQRLKSSLMAEVAREAAFEAAAGRQPSTENRQSRVLRAFGLFSLRPVLAAVAAFCVIAAGVGGYILAQSESVDTYAVVPVEPQSTVDGQLDVEADRAVLTLTGLPLISKDRVFQTWLDRSGDEDLVPSVPFVRDGKRRAVAVIEEDVDDVDRIIVTPETAYAGDPPEVAEGDPIATVDLR